MEFLVRLYDLSEQYNDLLDLLEVSDDREALQTMLDGLEDAFDDKVESIVKLIRSKAAEYNAIKAESDRLATRAARMAKDIDWLEHYIESQMIATGRDKVKSSLFTIAIANCPPAVNVLNESDIPDKFYTLQPAKFNLDKRLLLEALKAGEVSGAEIIQRKRLSIK